jgi:transglutaminase-like putative cysteine protease
MTLEQAFRISSILLAATGLTGLILAGEVPLGLMWLGYAAVAASLFQSLGFGTTWPIFHLSRPAWNVLIILALAGFVIDFLWLSPGLLQAGIHFMIALMVNKLLDLRQRKDFLHLYALSLLALLAAAALTVEIWYASVFVAYLLVSIWTLLLYHLKTEGDEYGNGLSTKSPANQSVQRLEHITLKFFWATNGMAIGALCLTVVIFFLTPRVGTGFFQKQRAELIRTTGFSEKVDLGVIGAVKLDQTVVMRVEFPDHMGTPSEQLYFRGVAYDRYDGKSWANSLSRRRTIGRNAEGVFVVGDRGAIADRVGLRQEILIEALDTPALFGTPLIQSLEGSFLLMQADGMGGLYLPQPPATRIQYTAYSVSPHLVPADRLAMTLSYPAEISRHYLQLPSGIERVRELAGQVSEHARSPFERVAAIERHLRVGYRYSLDVGDDRPANPVEAFLFVRKTGYCEHYATAMVLMLRTLGIPARLVTGFLHGEWNDFGNYYTVRQRDAHAWVEVYFPQSGWMTFDPTPTAGIAAVTPVWTQAVRMVDSMRLRWDRLVIRYSLRDQVVAMQGLREQGERIHGRFAGVLTALHKWMTPGEWRIPALGRLGYGLGLALLLTVLTAVGLVAARMLWRRRRRVASGLSTARQVAAVQIYSRMLLLLEARGLTKSPGATPLEFARLVMRQSAAAGSFVYPLTDLYCRVRFGREAFTSADQAVADEWLEGLRTMQG